METPEIQHHPEQNRFEMKARGQSATVDYEIDHGIMSITHTFVPPELRGGGLAAQLTRHALEYAREKKLRVNALCSYTAAYLRRHPEYGDLS